MLDIATTHVPETVPMRGEMRKMRRYALRLPLTLLFEGSIREMASETVDISARGACFVVDAAPALGAAFQFTLTFPPEITLAEAIRVRGRGRVVRVEMAGDGKTIVGAALEKLAYLPPL